MELLSVIRRWHYRDHFSIREISRRTGLSRNTVRKHLRSDSVEPKFAVPDRPSKLDPFADKLSHMLRQETGKSRKQKRTIKQLHADLVVLGYEAGTIAWRRLPATGRPPGNESRRPPAVACSHPSNPGDRSIYISRLAMRRPSLAATGQSIEWPPFGFRPIRKPIGIGPLRRPRLRPTTLLASRGEAPELRQPNRYFHLPPSVTRVTVRPRNCV